VNGQRILVVEDHEPLLKAIQSILEEEGYTVCTATDGLQALQMMEEISPALIVADIMMPRMDGYAFYEAVRARPEWVPIPFIFLTAKAEQEDVLKGKDMGAEDYLTKPFDHQELVVVVRSRLKRALSIQEVTEARFDQLKQQIINVLSHELRTPLTYVRGYTELALEEVPNLSPSALEDFLMGIKRGADRLNRLVEDLLLLIRLDTGRAIEEYRLLAGTRPDLDKVLEGVAQQYEERAAPVQLCEPFFVDAVGRLVDNAIKFSQGEGKQVTVNAHQTNGWVEIAIADEGVGIPPEELPHLFERFQQINRELMEQQGLGVGLAIAQELIRLHHGEITVESTTGVGSTFTIRLPVVQRHSSPDE